MAIRLARHSRIQNVGKTLLINVGLFGVTTILFALSSNFWLSLLLLALSGAFDMVSVVIRHVLVQTETPPEMRGRVSAVNLVFIGASNELGEFESGAVAACLGTVPAVVVGGIGTLVIVALWTRWFPEIRKLKSLA